MRPCSPTISRRLRRDYDAVLSDVWGVDPQRRRGLPAACEALTRFRDKGGAVVLISNAPRPGDQVRQMLDQHGRAARGL